MHSVLPFHHHFPKTDWTAVDRQELLARRSMPPLGPRQVRLFHYSSRPDLEQTDPTAYGSCGAGLERKRKDAFPDSWVPRTYFGTDKYERESCVGHYKYTTDVDANQLYNYKNDPLDLFSKAERDSEKAGWPHGSPDAVNRYEREISKQFLGYLNADSGVAVVFKKLPVQPIDEDEHQAAVRRCALDYRA